MTIFDFLNLIGGLALFLYGMHFLGESLEKQAGSQLRNILGQLTDNPVKGILVGIVVTILMQSSSAVTIMLVGFVNAGVMTLHGAVPVIMGANVGTTITAWILSLTGIQGDSFFLQLLKPANFSPVLGIIGAGMLLFAKSDKKKNLAGCLLGTAILIIGMETMSAAVKPFASMPEFGALLVRFQNPLLGVLAGAALTAVLQSSTASVGVLQAFAAGGGVTYGAAIPIVMGQNIGTCVTAMLSSIGANKNARRTALVHLYFNVIGTLVCLVVLITVQNTVGFALQNTPIDLAGVALVHSGFNIACTLILLPFTKQLEKLAYLTLPAEKEEREVYTELEERLLATPSSAVFQSKDVADHMARITARCLEDAISCTNEYSGEIYQNVVKNEKRTDEFEDKLGTYLIKLSSKNLSAQDSASVFQMLHAIGDMERIGDRALNVAQAAKEMDDKNIQFSAIAGEELLVMGSAVQRISQMALKAYETGDTVLAAQVEPLEQVVDELEETVRNRHIERLQRGECTIELGFILTDVITNYERIADHCSNLAVSVLEVSKGSFENHAYLDKVKQQHTQSYDELYKHYKDEFLLPAYNV